MEETAFNLGQHALVSRHHNCMQYIYTVRSISFRTDFLK